MKKSFLDMVLKFLSCPVIEIESPPGQKMPSGTGIQFSNLPGELQFFIVVSDGSTKGLSAQLNSDQYQAFCKLAIENAMNSGIIPGLGKTTGV